MAEQAEELDTVPELRCRLGDTIKSMNKAAKKHRKKIREEGKIELLRAEIERKGEERKMTRRAELRNIFRPEEQMYEVRPEEQMYEVSRMLESVELSPMKQLFKKYVLQFKNDTDIPTEMMTILPNLETATDEDVSAILVDVYADRIEGIKQKLEQRIETLSESEQLEIYEALDEIEGFEESYCNPEVGLFEVMDIFIDRVSRYIGGKRKKNRKTKRKSIRTKR